MLLKKKNQQLKMGKIRGLVVMLCMGFAFIMPGSATAQENANDEWQFFAAPYMWAAGIGGETATGGDVDIDFGTIIENLDMTFMGSFGAQKGKWGFVTDVIYLDIEDDSDVPLLGPLLTLTNVQMKSWIVTPTVTYSVVQSDQWSLDLLAGARYLWLEVDLDINELSTPLSIPSASGDAWDGIVGIKGQMNLNQNWYLPFHFDVGTGDTDLTWQAFAGVGYKFSNFDLIAGYRYLDWDFDDDDKGGETFNDMTISGPIVGAKFVF